MNIRTTDSQEQVIRRRYRTRSQTKRMIEETDARIECLENVSQESWKQMADDENDGTNKNPNKR